METRETRIIIDIGISFKQFLAHLQNFELQLEQFSRLYITHAHSDHVSGLATFLKRSHIPVYTRAKTQQVLFRKYPELRALNERFKLIDKPVCQEKDLKIRYFRLPHIGWVNKPEEDTGEHIGFLFECQDQRFSFMTDCGHLSDGVKEIIKDSQVFFIESNYDPDMQIKSSRPWPLKKRIMGDEGHLSNFQTADYLLELTDEHKTKHVFLAHMSKQCNTKDLAVSTILNKFREHNRQPALKIHTELPKRYFIS